jgi:hypothetical protein
MTNYITVGGTVTKCENCFPREHGLMKIDYEVTWQESRENSLRL